MIDPTTPTQLLVFFSVATAAGFIDAIAGGGGLITLPALLLGGLPPISALATNKLQAIFGTMTAMLVFLRRGMLSWTRQWPLAVYAFLGACLGTLVIQFLDKRTLDIVIPLILLLIGGYTAFTPPVSALRHAPRVSAWLYQRLVIPIIGCYDGMFGPGTGSFFTIAGVALRGEAILQAAANAKFLNFATNAGSVALFMFSGHVIWPIALSMMLGQSIGAYLATRVMLRHGSTLIRPIIVLVCFGMLVQYGVHKGILHL